MMRKIFKPPQLKPGEEKFRARFINGFAWTVIVLLFVAMMPYIINLQSGLNYSFFVLPGLIVVLSTAVFLFRRGYLNASGIVIALLGWLVLGIEATNGSGVEDVLLVALIAIGLLANFSTSSLRDAINHAAERDDELYKSNQMLQALTQTLEDRVSSRTSELQVAFERNDRRARQFEAIAQVTRAITSNQGIESLLQLLTEVISEKFGFYHVGIFLLDDDREFAILRAANSDGGRRMIARNHKLRIGQAGIVGMVAATGNPRIALDVEADAAYFDNPDLPETRSEMALPLQVSRHTLGLLDIQSRETNAFQPDDVDVLTTLADQVAVAIQNAGTFELTQRYLEDARHSSMSYLQDSWKAIHAGSHSFGYSISNNIARPLNAPLQSPMVSEATSQGTPAFESGSRANLAVPIRLGDTVVGALHVQLAEHEWHPDEIDIAQAVADRLSLALEATTLLDATKRRAEIERLTSDITGKIGASTRIDSILRTTAEELSRVLGGSDVLVQIQSAIPDELPSTTEKAGTI